MTNNKIRLAKKKDFEYFFKNEKILYSAKAWVLQSGKDRVAIGGFWIMPQQFTAFLKVKKQISKKQFWKASKKVIESMLKTQYPIVCFRDEAIINSKKYIEKLGFIYYDNINNKEIYKLWHRQRSL